MTKRTRITGHSAYLFGQQAREGLLGGDLAEELVLASVSRHSPNSKAGARASRSVSSAKDGLFVEEELSELESEYKNGITAVQIVELFTSRGIRFSEATFRKYVQQGLLPRSRRVGRKGKHRGSLGVYPSKVVRRINVIKSLMKEGYTIEEIQEQFLQFTDVIERLEEAVEEAFSLFRSDSLSSRFDGRARKSIETEILDAEKSADDLLTRIHALSKRFTESHEDSYRETSAAGSAEDLL